MRINIILTCICLLSYHIGMGQCFPDRHNANSDASWVSCTPTESPNPVRGSSHWIMYELDSEYDLYNVHLWNYNHVDDSNNGVSEIVIDVSSDGINWQEAGVFNVLQAEGSAFYQGDLIGSLGARTGSYVLITALDNHGGSCYGFSEIRIGLEPSDLLTDITPILTFIPTAITGVTGVLWTLKVQELENGPTSGQITLILPKDDRMNFVWDPNLTSVGPFTVDNSFWDYDASNSSFHIWTSTDVIQNQSSQTLGFISDYDPQNTSGIVTYTATLLSGSGNESNTFNNIDVETLTYNSEN